jgi:putative oxidoreductase
MRIASTVARILLGLAFTVAGAFGFILTFGAGPPAMPGLAGEFQAVIFHSHYVLFVDGVQLATGLALLANRFVALALVISAAILFNILAFHLTMLPAGIVPGLIATACWVLAALPQRERLAPLLSA